MSPFVRSVLTGTVVCGYDSELAALRKSIAHDE